MFLHAQPRSIDELDAIANSALRISGTRSYVSPLQLTYSASQLLDTESSAEAEAFYVYTPVSGNQSSFVIVSGDRRMPEVLGYSSTHGFHPSDMPDGLRWYLQKCQADAHLLTTHEGWQVVSVSASQPVAPLLGDIIWNQSEPFNNQCPEVNPWQRTVAGCTAIAVSQVMAYHKYPEKGTGRIFYNTDTDKYEVNVDFLTASPYDWANMIGSYNTTYTDAQADAVSQLIYHVGAALGTDYTANSSGASPGSPEKALINHFSYDDGIRLIRMCDHSADDWAAKLHAELYASRPIIVSGYPSNSNSSGHCFVFDGLDDQGNYHVNWGWGGTGNGYYSNYHLIPKETGIGAGMGNFSYRVQAVVGVAPDDGVREKEVTNLVADTIRSLNGVGKFRISTSIKLEAAKLMNLRFMVFIGDLQLMLTNADGTEIVTHFGRTVQLPNLRQEYYLVENPVLSGSLPFGIADGHYRLYIGVCQKGYNEWGHVHGIAVDGHFDYFDLVVSNGEYTLGVVDADASSIAPVLKDNSLADDTYFDLQGRPLNGHPTQKGIYIHQGKKVIVK